MNRLKKIILINSLFSYEEIEITGSLHIGGGMGTGKSSLLRAISAFYTGQLKTKPYDSQAEIHFLPKKNSWLIYEVEGSKGLFTVAMNRSLGSPSFYFINGDYEEELFRQKSTAKTASKVLEGIKSRKLHAKGPIEEQEEYLSILYGVYQGKDKSDLRKYAFATSPSIPYLPRLLSHICLGQTLPFSLINEVIFELAGIGTNPLNLNKISQGLKEFRKDQRDLLAFHSSETEVRKVVEEFENLVQTEEHQQALSQELPLALSQHQKRDTLLQEEEALNQKALADFFNESDDLIHQKQSELKYLQLKAGELAYKISVAQQKESHYQREKITEKHKQFEELRYKRLGFTLPPATSQKESKQTDQLAKEFLEASLLKEQELRLLQEETSKQIQQQADQEQAIRERGLSDRNILKEIQARIQVKHQALDSLSLQRLELEGKSYFEKEIEQTQTLVYQQLEESLTYRLSLELAESQLLSLQKRRDKELSALEKTISEQEKTFTNKLETLEKELETLSSLIANSGRAFMGWLEKNYPNWQQSIGKILKDEVLLSPFLNPGIERINELFYGIHLDLSDLPESELDLAALGKKKESLSKEIEGYKKEHIKLRKKNELQLANREKYFRQKHREQKRKLQKDEYELQQLQVAIKKGEASISTYKQQAVQERSAQLLKLSYEEVAIKDALEKEKKEREAIRQRIEEEEKKAQADLASQKKNWEKERTSQLKKIEKNWNTFKADWEKRNKTSAGKVGIGEEDFFIWESLQQLIFQYQADKRNYLDHAPYWQIEQAGILSQIANREADLFLSAEDRNSVRQKLRQKEAELKSARDEWEATELLWQEVKHSEVFEKIKPLPDKEEPANDSSPLLSVLLQKLTFTEQQRKSCVQNLSRSLQRFHAHYSADNSFGFPIKSEGLAEIKKSANTLKLFLEEEKAQDFEQAIHLKHAELILGITEESASFEVDIDGIEKRVSSLNQAMKEIDLPAINKGSHFAIRPSTKKIFQALTRIRDFHADHAQELGSSSLFNQGDKNALNTQAFQLLVELEEALSQYPENSLQISHAYELCLEASEDRISHDLSNYSPGLKRFIEVVLGTRLMTQILEGDKESPQFYLLLDQLHEFDDQGLALIQSKAAKVNIKLITAAPKPSPSVNYDQVLQVSIDTKQKRGIKKSS